MLVTFEALLVEIASQHNFDYAADINFDKINFHIKGTVAF